MKDLSSTLKVILEVGLLVALVVGLVGVFQALRINQPVAPAGIETAYPAPDRASEGDLPSDGSYPPPAPTTFADETPFPTETEFPTPTNPPFPTLLPTPLVTPIPVGKPPFIPLVEGQPSQAYSIVYSQEDNLYILSGEDFSKQPLVEVKAKSGLYLNRQSSWGAASPDGRYLALALTTRIEPFVKGQPSAEYSLHLYDLQNGSLELLVEDGQNPVWSPDGAKLAYRGAECVLWVIDPESKEQWPVYKPDFEQEHCVENARWSPEGNELVFIDSVFRQSKDIWAVDLAGNARELTNPNPGYFRYTPEWSPNGKQILYVSLEGDFSASEISYNLWVMESDGSGKRQLTKDIGVYSAPRWSPNGEWIVFGGPKHFEESQPSYDLWLVNVVTGELKRLTTGSDNESYPKWLLSGDTVFFVRDLKSLWLLSLHDGRETQLLDLENGDYEVLLSSQ